MHSTLNSVLRFGVRSLTTSILQTTFDDSIAPRCYAFVAPELNEGYGLAGRLLKKTSLFSGEKTIHAHHTKQGERTLSQCSFVDRYLRRIGSKQFSRDSDSIQMDIPLPLGYIAASSKHQFNLGAILKWVC